MYWELRFIGIEKRGIRTFAKVIHRKVLKKFNMHKCNHTRAPIVKGVKFEKFQCFRNQYEIDEMKAVPYASTVRSLMYV
jgi:hypothetical protein